MYTDRVDLPDSCKHWIFFFLLIHQLYVLIEHSIEMINDRLHNMREKFFGVIAILFLQGKEIDFERHIQKSPISVSTPLYSK